MSNIEIGKIAVPIALELRELTASINKAKVAIDRAAEGMKATLDKAAAESSQSMQRRFASMANKVGNTLLGIGAAAVAGFGSATKTAAEFDQSMRNVNSLAKLGEADFAKLKTSVMGVVDDPRIRQGPKDLAAGLYDIVGSGFQGQQALDILKQSAYAASAGMTTTAVASKVLTAVLNSGIGGVNSAREAMDVLFREVDLGVNTFEQLAGALGDVLPTAKTAGVSLQEVSAALAVMTRRGINVNESVTALNQLLIHIIKPGKEQRELMDHLGIQYGVTALQAKGLTGVLKDIIEKTHGNKQALIQLMPEIRGLKAMLALTDEQGQQYIEMLGGIQQSNQGVGSTNKALDEQNKGMIARYEMLTKAVESLKVEVGAELLPVVQDLVKWIKDQVQWFRNLTPEVRNNYIKFAEWTAGAVLAIGAASKLVGWIGSLRTSLIALGVSAQATGAALAGALSLAARLANPVALAAGMLTIAGPAGIGGDLAEIKDPKERLKHWNFQLSAAKEAQAQWSSLKTEMEKEKFLSQKFGSTLWGTPSMSAKEYGASVLSDVQRAQEQISKVRGMIGSSTGGISFGKGAEFGSGDFSSNTDPASGGIDDYLKGRGAGKSGLDELKRKAKEAKEALADVREELFKLTHSAADYARYEAQKSYTENIGKGVPAGPAGALRAAQIDKANKDERKFIDEKTGFLGKAVAQMWTTMSEVHATGAKRAEEKLKADLESMGKIVGEEFDKQTAIILADQANLQAAYDAIPEEMRLAQEEAASALQAEMELHQIRYEVGAEDARTYLAFLQLKLQGLKTYSADWMRVMQEMGRVSQHLNDSAPQAKPKLQVTFKKVLQSMRSDVEGILGGAFEDLFSGRSKDFFGDMLKGFEQMLAQMAARALVAGIGNMIFGGISGGFLGGIMSVFGGGGFDNPVNDRKAVHWGSDFSDLFARGAADATGRRNASGETRAAGGDTHININMGGVTMNNSADVDRLADQLAWGVQRRLRVQVGR